MRTPVVAIVGRPNVGKSTLFNRLAGRRISIVEDVPGVTRDRIYAEGAVEDPADGEDMRYTLIDTGGFEADPETALFEGIRGQAQLAIDEADLVLMVVDARAGIVPADEEVTRLLRRSGRPLVVAANKADGPRQEEMAQEFYALGVDALYPISAAHGLGIGAMLDGLFAALEPALKEAGKEAQREWERERAAREGEDDFDAALEEAEDELRESGVLGDEFPVATGGPADDGFFYVEDDEEALGDAGEDDELGDDEAAPWEDEIVVAPGDTPPAERKVALPEVLRLAVIGKPNAGKSSLVNKLLGEDRHLVSELPGTTMDAVDSFMEYGGVRYRLIDTAGIRRKRSISRQVEKYAVVAALKGLDRCDVALMLIDATLGLTEQDLKVAAFAHDKGKAILLLVNKWDLAKSHELVAKEVAQSIRDRAPFLAYAPIRFISAKTGRKVFDVLDAVQDVAAEYFTRVPTAQVNRVIQDAVHAHPPPVRKGRRVKIYFATQVTTAPPTFVLATNDKSGVHFSYERFLLNQLRAAFGFEGTPVRLFFRNRGNAEGRKKNLEARKRRAAKSKKKKGGARRGRKRRA